MKNLLYKEIKLVVHPMFYFMLLLSSLILVPSYPYIVGVSYVILAVFNSFNNARMQNDHFFTAMLPVPREQIVVSKHICVAYMELLQLIVAIPFAYLSSFVLSGGQGNIVGMDANFAFFGVALISFSAFNLVFLPGYFKTGYKAGIPVLFGTIAFIVVYGIFEAMNFIFPAYGAVMDSLKPETIGYRAILLVAGMAIYAVTMVISEKISAKRFINVNL